MLNLKIKEWLNEKNYSKNTYDQYYFTIKQFKQLYGEKFTKNNIRAYKSFLIENFKPKTVNIRLVALNSFLKYIGKLDLLSEGIKIQQKPFVENVISNADYEFLKNSLLKTNDIKGYFIIRYLGATGARVSEFCNIKIEHVKLGYFDIYGKGTKFRRIYIPKKLQDETIEWLKREQRNSGFLFLTRDNNKYTPRSVSAQIKRYALQFGIDKEVMYPHSFRHRFAKNFLEKYQDISFLADLMGHESIETTRIYLRKTSTEQKEIVDKIIDW
jgi:site-specific recombinase XerD